MPNWCENFIHVTGPSKDQKAFRDQIRHVLLDWGNHAANLKAEIDACKVPTKKLRLISGLNEYLSGTRDERNLFASFVKPPLTVVSEGYRDAGYNWCINNWGTRWDVDEFDEQVTAIDTVKEQTSYSFLSAWSPPIEWLKLVGPKFPTLTFSMGVYEGGCWFAGTCVVHDKECEIWNCPTDRIKEFAIEHFGAEFDDTEEDMLDGTTTDEGP